MIVPQDNKNTNKQSDPAQHQAGSVQQPPPPYYDEPSSVQSRGPSASQPFLRPYDAPGAPVQQNTRRESAAGRFCRAFLFACLIWLVFSLVVQSIVQMATHSYRDDLGPGDWSPLPDNVEARSCQLWSDEHHGPIPPMYKGYPYSSFVSYELPATASKLLFLSRGNLAAGRVKVVTSSEHTDKVLVDVGVYYHEQYILDSLRTCRIHNKEGSTEGVAILTPNKWRDHRSSIQFEMTIYLPEVKKQPLTIDNFETDMSMFAHDVADLEGKVYFKSLDLRSSNMPISVQHVNVDYATVKTSNSPITGTYHTNTSVELRTSNAPIKVDLGLHNDGKGKHTTEAILHTSNGHVISDIGLHNPHSDKGGDYSVNAHSSNAPFRLNFITAPINSALKLSADTSNSPASASLHPTYQGKFTLTSSNKRPYVDQHKRDDPEDRDRRRSIEYSSNGRNILRGSVRWDDKHKDLGTVDLKTSNSGVVLHL